MGRFKKVAPVLKRKKISINADICGVDILGVIKFENRAPPDTSADFEQSSKREALSIISDLSQVVAAFETAMVVEGHTGATTPEDYWQALAENRALLIVKHMLEQNVK